MTKALLLIISYIFLSINLQAEQLELDYVISFSSPSFITHEYRIDLDCTSEIDSNLNDTRFIRHNLKTLFNNKNISTVNDAEYLLRIYVTHHDCGTSGKIDRKQYPLGLGDSENNFADAYLRVIAELVKRADGEIMAEHEYITFAKLEKSQSRVLYFSSDSITTEVYDSSLWNPIAKAIVQDVQADIGAMS